MNDETRTISCNDIDMLVFLRDNGVKIIDNDNGVYILAYNADTDIDSLIQEYIDLTDKSMF